MASFLDNPAAFLSYQPYTLTCSRSILCPSPLAARSSLLTISLLLAGSSLQPPHLFALVAFPTCRFSIQPLTFIYSSRLSLSLRASWLQSTHLLPISVLPFTVSSRISLTSSSLAPAGSRAPDLRCSIQPPLSLSEESYILHLLPFDVDLHLYCSFMTFTLFTLPSLSHHNCLGDSRLTNYRSAIHPFFVT